MPTVVDSLIVTLGLDPKDFEKGQKAAAAAFLKTKQEAAKTGQDIESSAKRASDGIDRVTKSALSLFAVLVGSKGLGDFIGQVTTADAALGRMSTNAGMSTRDFQAWQMAMERVGGSAEGATASIQKASQQLVDLRVNGKGLPDAILRLGAIGGPININGSTQDYLLSVANAIHATAAKRGDQVASSLAQSAGFDTGFTNLAIAKGGAGLPGYLNTMPAVSDATVGKMQDLQNRWTTLQQTFSTFANTVVSDFEPAMKPFLGDLQSLGNELVKDEPQIAAFAKGAADIANSMGSWRIALEAIVALWAGGKLIGVLQGIGGLLGMGGGAAGGGALGWAARGLTGAVSGAASTAVGGAATVGGLAGAFWLASAGPAGAGEGDVIRRYNATHGGAGSRSFRNNNPGNIEYGPFAISMGATGSDGRFAIFPSYDAGRRAQEQLLFHTSAYSGLTLGQAIAKWAPSSENDVGAYVAAMGMPAGTLLSSMNGAQRSQMLDAMQKHEGWRGGAAPWWKGSNLSALSPSAQWASLSNHNVSNSSQVSIGNLHVHTQATDGPGIAKSIVPALKRNALIQPANTGPA